MSATLLATALPRRTGRDVMHSLRWLVAVWLLGMLLLFKPWVHGIDPVGYYAWLRSVIVDGSLDTTDEFVHYDLLDQVFPGPTGGNRNPYAVGSAVLWSPFFLAAHALSRRLGWPADGYTPVYVVATGFASALYALAALYLAYRVAADLFGARAAFWATLAVWWSTPLLFYMYCHPLMSHANDAFANALMLFVWQRTRAQRSAPGWLAFGATFGLACLVRLQNLVCLVLPLTEACAACWADRRLSVPAAVRAGTLFGLGALLVFWPQMVAWRAVYGSILPGNPYVVSGFSFDFTSPHFFDVLCTSTRSVLLWSPIVVLTLPGLVLCAWRTDAVAGISLTLLWLAQVYLIGSWQSWDGGAAFGQRFLVGSSVIGIVGLAALLRTVSGSAARMALALLLALLVGWNMLLMAQYIVGLLPHAGPVDLRQMILNQGRVVGVVAQRLEELLAARFGVWR